MWEAFQLERLRTLRRERYSYGDHPATFRTPPRAGSAKGYAGRTPVRSSPPRAEGSYAQLPVHDPRGHEIHARGEDQGDERRDQEHRRHRVEGRGRLDLDPVDQPVDRDEGEEAAIKAFATTYSGMKAKQAAKIFDEMVNENQIELVSKILAQMSVENRGDILAQMKEENAAKLTQLLEPNALKNKSTKVTG